MAESSNIQDPSYSHRIFLTLWIILTITNRREHHTCGKVKSSQAFSIFWLKDSRCIKRTKIIVTNGRECLICAIWMTQKERYEESPAVARLGDRSDYERVKFRKQKSIGFNSLYFYFFINVLFLFHWMIPHPESDPYFPTVLTEYWQRISVELNIRSRFNCSNENQPG